MRTDFVFKGVWLSESLQGAVPIGYPSSKNILVGRSEPRKGSCGAAALGSEGGGGVERKVMCRIFCKDGNLICLSPLCLSLAAFPLVYLPSGF